MSSSTQKVNTIENLYQTWKVDGAITDNDIGKPVTLSATDLMALSGDGDLIDGWIVALGIGTADGKVVCTILRKGRIKAILSGSSTFGGHVESAANEAAGTANAGDYALVSTNTPAATDNTKWRIISGAVTSGATVLLESV